MRRTLNALLENFLEVPISTGYASVSIRFRGGLRAYDSSPAAAEVGEIIRRDVMGVIEEEGFRELVNYRAEISEAGAHEGGTDPNESVHSTVHLVHVVTGRQLFRTFHVYHDPDELNRVLGRRVFGNPRPPTRQNRKAYFD